MPNNSHQNIEQTDIPSNRNDLSKSIILVNKKSSSFNLLHSDSKNESNCNNMSNHVYQDEIIHNEKNDFENINQINYSDEKLECENCKNIFYNQTEFENHLEACFYNSDYEFNKDLEYHSNKNFEVKKPEHFQIM